MDLKLILENHVKWIKNEINGIRADFREANLCGADLCEANLRGANLYGADFREADLRGADLRGANLREADQKINELLISYTSICAEGDIIGYKKCRDNIIVRLKIHAESRRSNATGRKCRAEFVEVLEICGAEEAISQHDSSIIYRVGEFITVDKFDENRWEECSSGIHFFITRLEAENY